MRNDKVLAIRVPAALRVQLERLANEREISVSALVRHVINKATSKAREAA